MIHDARGSLWYRWDLHFHTPSSYDYQDKSVTDQQIVDILIHNNIRVIAITDHHTMDVARIKNLQKLGGERLTVLPGIELRGDHGGDPIHYICLFPEDCDLDHVWTTLQGGLGLTAASIKEKGGDDRVYVPIEDGADMTRKLGGVVSIHAGAKSNSIEGIKNREEFQKKIKFDITKNWVDLMEIGQLKDIDVHLNKIFPHTGIEKPLIICSDNHRVTNYEVKAPLWFRADPNFRGLLMVLREPRGRIFIGDQPPEHIRIKQNPTKFIQNISFQSKPTRPHSEKWFSGSIQFNPGLVAIVGNRGSGKSALADMLGLLGSSKNAESGSFLHANRFRHPRNGFASHFTATLEWESKEKITRSLDEVVGKEEVERLKYLPQDHVEKVCNELVGLGERNFERELRSVIFSHVPESQRLGKTTLDELVFFHNGEKQKRIDTLLKQLRDVSRERAFFETQADPIVKQELQERINRRQLEILAHDQATPPQETNPVNATGSGSSADAIMLTQLNAAEKAKNEIEAEIAKVGIDQKEAEKRNAVAVRLLEKISNFEKEFQVFTSSLSDDAIELGLTVDSLVSVTTNKSSVTEISTKSTIAIVDARKRLEDEDFGLLKKLITSQAILADLHTKLDAPNRKYQAYLVSLAEWQSKKDKLVGSISDPDSLTGLQSSLQTLGDVPIKIDALKSKQINLAVEIHKEKMAQIGVLRTLYGAVQRFIDTHELAKDKLKLEFMAELSNINFAEKLLGLIALNRRGSFMGADAGRARSDAFTQIANWEDEKSVLTFLDNIDNALHSNLREEMKPTVLIHSQLKDSAKVEEVFDLLYGLEYVQPRYVLRWEGKELSMLSPGERGLLLLVFYLLIDQGDMPLVIDQPESNLDNHTVAKILVDCIRKAREKRQVFIVTHNPNIAVVCDADQVIYAQMDKANGNAITYLSGSLESKMMSDHVTDVLEGTRWAFGVRGAKYQIGE